MTYRELLYKATRLIDNNKITLGEYDEMTKPLDREVEQEPIPDKLRAEIESYKLSEDELSDMDEDSVKWGMKIAYDIVDKYKSESEKA